MIKSDDSCWLSNKVIHTFEVLRTLSLLTRLADYLDRSAGERPDNPFGLVIGSGCHNFDQRLNLFLLLVNIGDEEARVQTRTVFDSACTRWKMYRYVIGPRKPFVELVLLQILELLPQLVLKD